MKTADTAFSERQFSEPFPDGIHRHYWTLARNRTVLAATYEALSHSQQQLVVDVGCGRGITLEYLRRHGLQVLGCDLGQAKPISSEIAPFLRYGTNATELELAERERAGVILLLDVLEHLPKPAEFLSSLGVAFPNARTVVITVPARQEVWSNYDEHYGHFRRYDLQSAGELFDARQFTVVRQRYLYRLLYPPARLMNLAGLKRGTSIVAPAGLTAGLHRVIAAWFGVENALLPGQWPGTSLMLVLQRKAAG